MTLQNSNSNTDGNLPSSHLDYIKSQLNNSKENPSSINSDLETISNPSSTASSKYQSRRYIGKLPISDVPKLMDLCNHFLQTKNITGLAMIARQSGLPPHLRYKIWPILLKSHPFVQHPYLEIDNDDDDEEEEEEEDDDDDDEEEEAEEENDNHNDGEGSSAKQNNNSENEEYISTEKNEAFSASSTKSDSKKSRKSKSKENDNEYSYKIPYKEIKFDLRKYLRSAERYKPKVMTLEVKDMFEIQEKIFEIIEHAIIKFLKKWGTIVHYNSALTWIALGLAEWVPPLPNSQFVLCGRDDVAKNGTKLRNVNDSVFETLNSNHSNITSDNSSLLSSPFSETPDSATPSSSPQNTPTGFKQMSFAEIYERMVLVVLYTPDPSTIENSELLNNRIPTSSSKELKKLALLPYTGGPIADRISFFLFCMRKLLPELHDYLAEEDCLNGDWILWWLKYSGSKVWSRYDRGRTWDLLLGYRTNCKNFESDMKYLSQLTHEEIALLGQDIFWNPMETVNDAERKTESAHNKIKDENLDQYDFSLSPLTLMSRTKSPSISFDKTPTLTSLQINSPKTPISNLTDNDETTNNLPSLDEIEPIVELPFSKIHPHVEIIFISLAFLKSKEFTITELDQSEIKTLFGRLSSLRTDFGEMNSFVSTTDDHVNKDSANNNTQENKVVKGVLSNQSKTTKDSRHINGDMQNTMLTYHRKSNRDIENILIEAGELWRRFLYINMMEESGLEKM